MANGEKLPCEVCPHNSVSTFDKVVVGLLVGLLVMWPTISTVAQNLLSQTLQATALAVAVITVLPVLCVFMLSLLLLIRTASSGLLETAITAAGLPAVLTSLLRLTH